MADLERGTLEATPGRMNTPHEDESPNTSQSSGTQPLLNLSQLLALARTRTIDEQRMALEQVRQGAVPVEAPAGIPYLLFTCADVACAAPLTYFREVLPTLPTTVALPFSPSWMLGFFALHTGLIGLVDPAPFLFGSPEFTSVSRARTHNGRVIIPGAATGSGENWRLAAPESGPTALIIGSGEHMLALAVAGVSDLAYVQEDEVHSDQSLAGSGRVPAAIFRAGVYAQRDGTRAFNIINVDALLAALLTEMERVEASANE